MGGRVDAKVKSNGDRDDARELKPEAWEESQKIASKACFGDQRGRRVFRTTDDEVIDRAKVRRRWRDRIRWRWVRVRRWITYKSVIAGSMSESITC